MVFVYMIVICLSTLFAAWIGLRAWRRVAPLANLRLAAGPAAAIPAIGFLIVVSAPAEMLTGVLLLGVVLAFGGYRAENMIVRLALLASSVLLGLTALGPLYDERLIALPLLASYAIVAIWWYVVSASALFVPMQTNTAAYGALASLVAVASAALLVPAANSIAFDAAIIISAIAGMLLAGGGTLPFGIAGRAAIAFLIAYLQIEAVWQGAWMAGLASALLWLGACGWSWIESEKAGPRYA